MKKFLILYSAFFLLPFSTFAQHWLSKVSVSFDVKQKTDLIKNHISSKYIEHRNRAGMLDDLSINLGIYMDIKTKFDLEVGFYEEFYWNGFYLDHIPYGGQAETDGLGNHLFVRGYFSPFNSHTNQKKVNLKFGVGYIHSWDKYRDGKIIRSTGITQWSYPNSETVTIDLKNRLTQEYGLNKTYHFLEGRILLDYNFWKWLTLYTGGGYVQGFKTISITNAEVFYNAEPAIKIRNTINGSNWYMTFGIRIKPFHKKTKNESKQLLIPYHPQKGISKFSFTIDLKEKMDMILAGHITNIITPRNRLGKLKDLSLNLGVQYQHNKKIGYEIGFYKESYWNGFSLTGVALPFGDRFIKYETANHLFLRTNYTFSMEKLAEKRLRWKASFGYIYARGRGWKGLEFSVHESVETSFLFNDGILITTNIQNRLGQEYGFHKAYHFIELRSVLEHDLNEWLTIYAALGYVQGFKTMSIVNAEIYTNTVPSQQVLSTNKGSNLYLSFGVRVSPFYKKAMRNIPNF